MFSAVKRWRKNRRDSAIWAQVAAMRGFNELARDAETIGERLVFRMLVELAEKRLESFGVPVTRSPSNAVTFTVPFGRMSLVFRESDWELMRAALQQHDAERKSNETHRE